MTNDLMQFLRDRLDEDKRIAEAARSGPWKVANDAFGPRVDNPSYTITGNATEPDLSHIARHHPSRVLREVEAKRQLLDALAPIEKYRWSLRLLALPYADHPDYQQEWTL